MKNFRLKQALELSRKQAVALLLSSILILVLAFLFEASHQYNEVKSNFDEKVSTLLLQQQQIEKRTDILLNSLSQYYATSLIKSNREFEHFAKGLYKHSDAIHAIGFAELISKKDAFDFEQIQHQKGFESFKIGSKGLFKQETPNTSRELLPISIITPLSPFHSIYLSEDLFSLPGVAKNFKKAAQANQTHTELLQSANTKYFYTLTLLPVYLNDPSDLSSKQRQQQVKGAVFIILPIEQIIVNNIKAQFPSQHIFFSSPLPTHTSPLFSQMNHLEHKGLKVTHTLEFPLEKPFSIVSSQANTQLNLIKHWYVTELRLLPLLASLATALIIYLSIVFLSILVYRYTQHLQQTQNRLVRIIATSQDAVIVTNKKGYIQVWNPVASQLFGYSEQEALGQCIMLLIFDHPEPLSPDDPVQEKKLFQEFSTIFGLNNFQSDNHKLEIRLHTRSGKKITAEVAISILNNLGHAQDIEVSLFIKDMTYQRQTEAEIKQLAYFDPLTNLENRTYFKSQIEQIILENTYDQFALLFLDLDGFKQVNDSLGHSVGDELLVVISKRIVNTLRGTDRDTHICRFGGDEFVLMLGGVNQDQVPTISLRLLRQIERLVKFQEDELKVSGSIGIALYPQHGSDVDTLLRHADTAMYQSKDSGKNTYSIYNDVMEERLSKRLLLEKHLRRAISFNEFALVYQPKIDILTGSVVGVEGLLRWSNPVLGLVPPDEFIPIAEESNLIIDIGNWVAEHCIEQLSQWKETSYKELHIAINVSSQQLQHPDFLQSISSMMKSNHLSPSLLEIELTERTIMSNAEENIRRFNEIRAQGFELSVDDFGTGYSSLSYLKKFPLSILKIDKSFVDGLPVDDEDVSIAKAILSLAHNLNMRVVAEGVETPEQLVFLKDLSCNLAQGYYISRPLSIEALETWLTDHKEGFYPPNTVNRLYFNHELF